MICTTFRRPVTLRAKLKQYNAGCLDVRIAIQNIIMNRGHEI